MTRAQVLRLSAVVSLLALVAFGAGARAAAAPVFAQKKIDVDLLPSQAARTTVEQRWSDELVLVVYVHQPMGQETTKVQIQVHGRTVFDRSYHGLSPTRLTLVGVPAVRRPIVAVDLFSGGAHCCVSTVAVEAGVDPSHTYARTYDWRDYPPTWRRVGADRHYALVAVAGTGFEFGSFADSTGPVVIYDYCNHRLIDMSARYPEILAADSRMHLSGTIGASALVAYLADEYRLGQAENAWLRVWGLYRPDDFGESTEQFFTHASAWLHENRFD